MERKNRQYCHRVEVGVELGGQNHIGDEDTQDEGEEKALDGLPEGDAGPAQNGSVTDREVAGELFHVLESFVLRVPWGDVGVDGDGSFSVAPGDRLKGRLLLGGNQGREGHEFPVSGPNLQTADVFRL